MEEERSLKLKQLSDARERQKREILENKMRRVQLADSCEFFKSLYYSNSCYSVQSN